MWNRRLVLSLLALLSACGGGGGPEPTPVPAPPPETRVALQADNQQAVARLALQAAGYPLQAAELGTLGTLLPVTGQAPLVRTLALSSEVLPCVLGGSWQVSFDDANGNKRLDAGDSLSTELRDCAMGGAVLNGKLLAGVRELGLGLPSTRLVLQLTLQDLSRRAANGDLETGQGAITLTLLHQASGEDSLTLEASQLEIHGRQGGQAFRHELGFLRVQQQQDARQRQIRVSALLSSSEFGGRSLSLETEQPFVVLAGDLYPSSGQVLLRGARGSQLRLVALNAQQLRVDLDENGDGVFERSSTFGWPQVGGWR